MEKIFENKVALVTGGSFGQIEAAGGEALFVKCDVSKAGDIITVIDTAFSSYGRLDLAFNNAGIEGVSAITQHR